MTALVISHQPSASAQKLKAMANCYGGAGSPCRRGILARCQSLPSTLGRHFNRHHRCCTASFADCISTGHRRQRPQTVPTCFYGAESSSKIDPRAWANRQPEIARKVLEVPPVEKLCPPLDDPTGAELTTLESYLQWRGWDIDKRLSSKEEVHAATSLVSHPLTFPLTLGSQLDAFTRRQLQRQQKQNDESSLSKQTRLCCIGARAEATLPMDYWREMLIVSSALSADKDTTHVEMQWRLDMIGPDILNKLPSQTIKLQSSNGAENAAVLPWAMNRTLRMNFQKTYLHQYIMKRYEIKRGNDPKNGADDSENDETFYPSSLLSLWDGFVLFNPGIGHPNLQKGWRPTLRYVLTTGKPVIITAHSKLDSARDWSVLKQTLNELEQDERKVRAIESATENPYKSNPFASRMKYEDPCCDSSDERKKLVRPNALILFIPGI